MLSEQQLSVVQGQNSLGSTGGPCNLDHDIKNCSSVVSIWNRIGGSDFGLQLPGVSAPSHLQCSGQILLLLRNGCWACK